MLLLDENGNREDNWRIHFSLMPGHPEVVVHNFLVDDTLERFHDMDVESFAQYLEQPFYISSADILILNRDCSYEQEVLDALQEMIVERRGCGVSVLGAVVDELSSIVSDLTRAQLTAFRFGRPLWISRALHRPLRQGEHGQSDRSDKLRKALRGWARTQLIDADSDDRRHAIARQFSVHRVMGINATRMTGGKRRLTQISDTDLMGLREAVLISFFADVDPDLFQDHYRFAAEESDALFAIAKWLGRFYRLRSEYLTPVLAAAYLGLLAMNARPEINTPSGQVCEGFSTITSFLTPTGLDILQGAAELVVQDNVGRKIYACAPGYGDRRAKAAPARSLKRRLPLSKTSNLNDAIPASVGIPVGRLLIPGNYSDAWESQYGRLLEILKEPTISMT